MDQNWKRVICDLSQIKINAKHDNKTVLVRGIDKNMQCIGFGTDAAVFRHLFAPTYAFKVYADEKLIKLENEKKVYQIIGDSPFFPTFYEAGDRYLVLSFEEGITLYDCLLQGIYIPFQVINDVEEARKFVRHKGLNPRDIHLKNILLQNGRAKIVDVSEYLKIGKDYRWEYLKRSYQEYYDFINGKPIPYWVIETIKKMYDQSSNQSFKYEEFAKKVTKLLLFGK